MTDIQLTERLANWLEDERKIPVETAVECGVTAVKDRLAFEYRRAKGLQYRKVRIEQEDGEKSFARDRKGAETCLFLEHLIEDEPDLSSPLVVTEGELDAVSLVACGIPNVVSVPDGAQLNEVGKGKIVPTEDKPFGWLWEGDRMKPHLAAFQRVILAVDGDAKGKILFEELSVRFERWKCSFVRWPEGCKDANEVLCKYGAEALRKVIEDAKPVVPNRLCRFGDLPDTGEPERYPIGIAGLRDKLNIKLQIPELCVITGEPGSGKSEFAAVVCASLANDHGLPGAILQFEDSNARVFETLTRYAKWNVDGVRGDLEARAWVDRWIWTMRFDGDLEEDMDLKWLEDAIKEARVRHGCKWLLVDPWNEIEHCWDRNKTEAMYVNDALRRLKRLARHYQIILMILVHPSMYGARESQIETANLYMVSGSAAWANKADHGIILMRPDKSKPDVYVKVAKSKDHRTMGTPGICSMQYAPQSAQFRLLNMVGG